MTTHANICISDFSYICGLFLTSKLTCGNCWTMQCSSVVSRFVTFCSVCLFADFLLVVNLLLGDRDSADFSNLCVCYVVNIQGITRDLRLKLMVLINLKRVKWMLKLIALTLLMVDMMTSQGRIGAMFVTNVLRGGDIWTFMNECTLEKDHFNALSAINGIHLRPPWINIWIFIELNTSAHTVANAASVVVIWQYTGEVIQERNHMYVLFVATDLHGQIALWSTAEFTVERDRTNVMLSLIHISEPTRPY